MAIQTVSFLLVFFALIYVVLVLYMRLGWDRIPLFTSSSHPLTRVSVVIAARNEEQNIARTIRDILAQHYPGELLEIIVIDDHSTDNTAEIIRSFAAEGVKFIKLNTDKPLNSYKKRAISEGIAIATGELIVTTDADCRMGKEWLCSVVSYYEQHGAYMVSSPVIYSEEKSLFEKLQTLEFLYLIGLGAAAIGNKHPSTCNGANLAYKREVFYEMGGFQGIEDLASGDDELFLHKVAAKYPEKIGFCKSTDAVVYTDAKENLSAFISQRKRWASKSTRYKDKTIVWLGICIWLFNLMLLIAGIGVVFNMFYAPLFWGALFIKMMVEVIFLLPLCQFANRRKLLFYMPLLNVLHVLYMVCIGIAGNIGKYQWKGRKVK